MSDLNFISTVPRCDLCYSEIKTRTGECSRCSNCLTWYHLQCEKKFYGKNFPNNTCYKCTVNETETKCIVCGMSSGLMINVNKKNWIHVLCLKSLKDFFYLKTPLNYILRVKAMLKKKKKCSICMKRNHFVMTCKQCKVNFHPYCAFRSNFDIENKEEDNEVIFPCNKKHLRYIKNSVEEEDNDDDTDYISNDESFSFDGNEMMNVEIEEQETNEISKSKKEKSSVDLKYLKNQLIINGAFNQFHFNSTMMNGNDEHQKKFFDWNDTDRYFYNFENKELNKIFFENTTQSKNQNLSINNKKEYKICTILKNNSSYFVVYDTTDVKKEDLLLTSGNEIKNNIQKTHYDFINKKRNVNRRYAGDKLIKVNKTNSDNIMNSKSVQYKDNIKLLRAFKLNSISNKILALEKYSMFSDDKLFQNGTNYDEDYSAFVDSELKIKNKMYEKIQRINKLYISKIKQGMLSQKNKSNYLNNQRNTPLHKLNSDYIYSSIMKRLGGGILSKSKDAIVEDNNYCECCICFDYNVNTLTPIIYCDKCNVGVHQSCYGIQYIPEKEYLCDICKSKYKNVRCVLCNRKNGAFKRIDRGNYAHVTCILLSNYYKFTDYALMDSVSQIGNFINTEQCESCKHFGEVFICRTCGKKYHFFCAYFNGFYLLMRYKEDERYPFGRKGVVEIICCTCGEKTGQWTEEDRKEQEKIRKGLYMKET